MNLVVVCTKTTFADKTICALFQSRVREREPTKATSTWMNRLQPQTVCSRALRNAALDLKVCPVLCAHSWI